MKNFVLIGAAGYVAPRHLKAIKDTDNNLVAAMDPFDSVGILDSYFPDADFFVEFERFDRHIEKLKRSGVPIDYVSVCSPNYLHDAHIRFGLRHGADVICEKPIVLNPWNIDALTEIEAETSGRIYTILQLRLHPSVVELKKMVSESAKTEKFSVRLKYITARGSWYKYSWKGHLNKSGGIATNIGIHFFDMLTWVFGDVVRNQIDFHEETRAKGNLELEKANVSWYLSIDAQDLKDGIAENKTRTFRSILIDDKSFEFSQGFDDLHTISYQQVLDGKGFGMESSRKAIEIVHQVRNADENFRG